MRETLRKWWPWIRAALVVAVLLGVGWQFVRILQHEALQDPSAGRTPVEVLWARVRLADPLALAACALLYLLALVFALVYWVWLVRLLGERLPMTAALRGYYLSHLAKYVPGKGLALLMRTTYAAEAGVRPGVAAVTAVYETLTLMASGALLAAVLFSTYVGEGPAQLWQILALLALALMPILPGVFNRLVLRQAGRFMGAQKEPLPHLGYTTLGAGLLLLGLSWFIFGASLEAILATLKPDRPSWTPDSLLQSTAFIAVSYVAGFLASTPGGLGVREFLLHAFLAPQLEAEAVVAVLLLRLLWISAEVVMAGFVWWLPVAAPVASSLAAPDPQS